MYICNALFLEKFDTTNLRDFRGQFTICGNFGLSHLCYHFLGLDKTNPTFY